MITDVIFRVFSAVVQKISDFKSDSELRLRSAKGKNASQDLCLREKTFSALQTRWSKQAVCLLLHGFKKLGLFVTMEYQSCLTRAQPDLKLVMELLGLGLDLDYSPC